jgi:hypothetical protein
MKQSVKSEIRMTKAESCLGSVARLVIPHSSFVMAAAMLLGAAGAPAQQTNVPSRLDYNSFRMISDRNIFNPNRYARSTSRTRTDSRPSSRVDSFTLVGLMAYEKGVFAFFDGTSAGYKKTLEANGTISEFKLTGLTPEQARLVSGTNEFVMRVGMQVRREDEGDWFLTEAGQTTRNRVVVSRGRTRSSTGDSTTGLPEGATEVGMEGEPEIIVIESEPTTDGNNNGNGDVAPADAEPANNGNGITDPVLLRLMQRRQELNQ